MTDDSPWRRPGGAPPPASGLDAVPDADFDEAEPTAVVRYDDAYGDPYHGGTVAEDRDPTPVAGIALVKRPFWRRHWVRRTLLGSLAVLLLCVAYYAVTLFQVWSAGHNDQARKVDAIVVMGAAQYDGRPSPLLRARLDHALLLYQQKFARVIVVTGGKQSGDRFTEAAASRRYLRDQGVPSSAILAETEGHTSWESLQGVAAIMKKRTERPSVLIVTDPFHCLRSRLIAEDLGLDAYVSATETSPWGSGTQFRKSIKEAAGVALGRIIGFGRL